MKSILFFSVFFLIAVGAKAQLVFTSQENELPVHLQKINIKSSILEKQEPFVPNVTDTYLPGHLQSSLQYFRNQPQVMCLNSKSTDYAISLTIKGDYQGCYQYAKNCLQQSQEKTFIPLIIQGARCAALDYEYEKAYQLFREGLVSSEFTQSLASAYLIEFGSLALNSNYANELDDIVNLHPQWTALQKNLAKGLIEFMGAGLPEGITKQQVFDFVDQELKASSSGFYEKLLKSIRISNYLKDYQDQKAYDYLVQDAIQLTNPLDWWRSGFNILYAVANGIDFSAAKNFYLAFLPFAHDKLTTLPTERNVYNYTQIYAEACKGQMLQEPQRDEFDQQLNQWRNGTLALDDLIASIQAKPTDFLNQSDVMSTLGSLFSIQGQYDQARGAYWKAHQLCPYNNRSHWGLVLLERRKKFKTFPEFASNENFVETTLQNVHFPEVLKKFIPNYLSFPEVSQHRIQFAARIWAPYIQALYDAGHHAYVKLPFELLSQVPNFADVRDTRIGPPDMPTYLYDNRLWDDVRGAGGETVAADHDEIFQAVHGDYNLLGHEMAHQFHQYITNERPELNTCIQQLHANATKRDLFADGYSKSSMGEYFAQGISYYLIPENSPARYGTNVSWFQKNDPDFYKFMFSIEKANGAISKIVCPISLD